MKREDLPDGWKLVKFGDVVRKVSDRVDPESSGIDRYVAGEHMETDELRIRTWGEVGDGYLGPAFQMRFVPGQVLYGSRRTYLRKVAVADFEGICANTTFVLESDSSELLPEFLPHVMTTELFHEHSMKQSKGSVNPYINFSDLTWYEFALPPIDEQRRISKVISATDQLVGRLTDVSRDARTLASSVFDELTNCESSPVSKLSQVATLKRGYSFKGSDYGDASGHPFMTLASVSRFGGYRSSGVKYLKHPPKSDCCAERGEILIANTDLTPSREFIGRPFLVPKDMDGAGFSHHLSRLQLNDPSLAEWLYWELQTPDSRRFVTSSSRGSTVIMLDMKRMGDWPVRLPGPSRRIEILDQVNSACGVAVSADFELKCAIRFRKALLNDALGGASV